jgi:hypothetical protein
MQLVIFSCKFFTRGIHESSIFTLVYGAHFTILIFKEISVYIVFKFVYDYTVTLQFSYDTMGSQ